MISRLSVVSDFNSNTAVCSIQARNQTFTIISICNLVILFNLTAIITSAALRNNDGPRRVVMLAQSKCMLEITNIQGGIITCIQLANADNR